MFQTLWFSPRSQLRSRTGNQTLHAHGPLLAAYYGARRDYSDMNDEPASEDEIDDVDNPLPG